MLALFGLAICTAFGLFLGLLQGKPRWMMDGMETHSFDFQEIFGINPLVPNYYRDAESWRVVVQGVVDRILKSKAELLHVAFENETRFAGVVAENPSPNDDEVKNSRNAKQEAEKSKRSFWQAHHAASYFVAVRHSYKDYLLSDEEWEAKRSGRRAEDPAPTEF